MQVRRTFDYRHMPWKNGGGDTIEIAIAPHDADIDTFDWRISMASVATDGPFSTFTGIDRTLCVLEGTGISLQIGDASARILDEASDPFAFSGDTRASATLVDGPITDFNVMTRRGRFAHTVRRVRLERGDERTCDRTSTMLFCHTGIVDITSGSESARLDPCDSIVRDATETDVWHLRARVPAMLYLVTIVPS